MYETYYGLRERPFELTSNPRFLLMTPRHQEVLCTLEHGIAKRKGLALVVGVAGTGKTTLVHAALGGPSLGNAQIVYVNNPTLTRTEFLEVLADGFGLSSHAVHSKTRLLTELTRLVSAKQRGENMPALIVDEAQSMPDELLEEIRLLSNIETPSHKLLSIVLVGQPDLGQRLNRPAFQQLKQRVALRAVLLPLTEAEAAAYVETRLRVAGGEQVFTPEAVATVFAGSGGIPRVINVICDNALVSGFALNRRPVDRDVVLEVCRDLDLDVAPAARETPAHRRQTAAAPERSPDVAEKAPVEPEAIPDPEPAESPGMFRLFRRARPLSVTQVPR